MDLFTDGSAQCRGDKDGGWWERWTKAHDAATSFSEVCVPMIPKVPTLNSGSLGTPDISEAGRKVLLLNRTSQICLHQMSMIVAQS
jgi:hypothetical protein